MGIIKKLFGKPQQQDPASAGSESPHPAPTTAPDRQTTDDLISKGQTLEDAGHLEEAEKLYRKAAEIDPQCARAYLNIGNVLETRNNLEEAEANYRLALKQDPEYGGAYANLGKLCLDRHEYSEALELYTKAAQLIPGLPGLEALVGIGFSLSQLGRHRESIAAYEKALMYAPYHEGANLALAHLLIVDGQHERTATLLERFLARNPDQAQGLGMLAETYIRLGMIEEGIRVNEKACKLEPDNDKLASMRLFMLNYDPRISPEKLFDHHKAYADRFFSAFAPKNPVFGNTRDKKRKLRIGYVSADFREHPVAMFIETLIQHHDRSQFEIHAWHTHVNQDHITRKFINRVDHWHSTPTLSDNDLAEDIRKAGIDILIDLSGYSSGHRLPVFARKPAPVQATWLGYLGTTGLETMDYRICDAFTDPPGMTEHLHTETLARLPRCQWCHIPYEDLPDTVEAPILSKGHITLGSFNNITKLNREVLALWARLLAAIPDARLHLAAIPEGRAQQQLLAYMKKKGIDSERLRFIPRMEYKDYLKTIAEVDIALDPFPYNGGTTSVDTLVMGVPFVTLAGKHSIARGGVSLLSNTGLSGFIAQSPEDYISIIKHYSEHPEEMSEIRKKLKQDIASSPILDGPAFTRDFENMYRQWWQLWCDTDR